MFKAELERRGIPVIPTESIQNNWEETRQSILNLLCDQEYGVLPPNPIDAKYTLVKEESVYFCAGKAVYQEYTASLTLENGVFTFPFFFVYPKNIKKSPVLLHISPQNLMPNKYMPIEEIIDLGFAVASFGYKEITSDDTDFSTGLAKLLFPDGKRTAQNAPGKITMWAWAAMRVMDFLQTQNMIDKENITVAGHSRLGKTALLTAALDQRFACAHSNDSGCCGAALSRGKVGENIQKICTAFPYWFCENLYAYMGKENELPFDQHFLISAIAPRKVYIASAAEDTWADPKSEFLSGIAASETYKALGLEGLVVPDEKYPEVGSCFHEGNIGYHCRAGAHFFSREDWQKLIQFLNKHSK